MRECISVHLYRVWRISKNWVNHARPARPATLYLSIPAHTALQNNNYNPRTLQQTKNYEELMFYSPEIALKGKFFYSYLKSKVFLFVIKSDLYIYIHIYMP